MMVFNLLQQPYPFGGSHTKKASLTLGISLFVFIFLFAFAPFGLAKYQLSYRIFVSFGFGVVCAAAMAVNFYGMMPFLRRHFDEEKWTISLQILWVGGILLTIGLFNSIYSGFIGLTTFSAGQFLIFILYVLLIGVFPTAGVVVFDYWRLYRKHAANAEKLKKKLQALPSGAKKVLVLKSDNQKEQLRLNPEKLLYLSSADNYVEVTYLVKSGIKKELLRGSLKSFEKQLIHSSVIRCHRSFMVNLLRVAGISGNTRGYKLKLQKGDHTIPVSRSYADDVVSRLDN
jgi:hypothetical protein